MKSNSVGWYQENKQIMSAMLYEDVIIFLNNILWNWDNIEILIFLFFNKSGVSSQPLKFCIYVTNILLYIGIWVFSILVCFMNLVYIFLEFGFVYKILVLFLSYI